MFKKNFLFILLISILTLVVLVVGALTLYKDNSQVFLNNGYILETTTETNSKYYFSANTKYKENVDEKIAFEDTEKNKVSVDPASFIHYENGNIAFLQKGALVNLADITSPMVSYYNITGENVIIHDKGQYTVTSNNKQINIESFVGRINDNKYIIAGKNLTLRIPTETNVISGDYFEINYIEEGIVKIDNEEHSYQVTAQDSYIYVGNNIIINLGDGKIIQDNDAKMLLAQITINGNENINLDVPESNTGGGAGDGEGEKEEEKEENGTGEEGEGTGSGEEEKEETEVPEEDETEEGKGNGIGSNTTASLQVELTKAEVTSTSINLSLQLNNANLVIGTIEAWLTNVSTGDKMSTNIPAANGSYDLTYSALTPNTNYTLTIVENNENTESEIQYFQKTFITKDLGLTLEKTYATSDELAYKLIFDENSEVEEAHITILDKNGENKDITTNEFTISKEDINTSFSFTELKSNSSYSIKVDKVIIDNTAYTNVYNINRIDTTLKETPQISGVSVDSNAEEVKFTIKLANVVDNDKSIISYTYNVYLADDITTDNIEPQVQYSITKADSDPLVLNLNEIDELKTGVDYRCKIVAQYNDNEMIREVSSDYSGNFLIKSKPKIEFKSKSATMNKVEGTISLIDANCTVPMKGRSCSNKDNTFTLRYYELSEEETTDNDTLIKFNTSKLTYELSLDNLKSNTTYAVKVFGNYYDDDNALHNNVQLGETFYITTDKSENIYFEVAGDNISGLNKDGSINLANVVTFEAKLSAPQNSTIMKEISTVTLNLYSGRYNTPDKLIGTYTIDDRISIEDMFNNITITNTLFDDVTGNNLGKIDELEKLIKVTNNSNGTLNSAYTVEVESVYDSTGKNKITVENNIYTFNLTPSYYLDARIATNTKETYVTVTPITKEQLMADEEEYKALAKTVKNLDDLNNDTVVGLTIENSLSDIFVDSAYDYEKVTVNYTICNKTLYNCETVLDELSDSGSENDAQAKGKIKIISVDMGNKYQPKSQTIYLDSSEYENAKKYFLRGYTYYIGFYISFSLEDGSMQHYNNKQLHKTLSVERQTPIYTQYISTSTATDITYRYSFRDVDSALADSNFYYTLGEDKENHNKVENALIADGEYHNVTLPIQSANDYTLYYARKNTNGKEDYIEISTNKFEGKYSYNEEKSYTILEEAANVLKIKLEHNDITDRAVAYKVVIEAPNNTKLTPYTKYFLASKLGVHSENTGKYDNTGNPITDDYGCIEIDYANISKFMGEDLKVTVYSYYDSGLVGYNQKFENGLILRNEVQNKYLNIYNNGSGDNSTVSEENSNMGIYLLKKAYEQDGEKLFIYNKLMNTKNYNSSLGASYYNTTELAEKIGIEFEVNSTNAGMSLTYGSKDYLGYDAKVLNEAKLVSNNDTYKFETIIPTISVVTNENTINSIKVNITASGIYGTKQFIKDNKAFNTAYVNLYEDAECTKKLSEQKTTINIEGNDKDGYKATINSVEFKNLSPDTTYYFKIYAYVNNKLTQLYDSSSTTHYIAKTYISSTLNSKGIINGIKFFVTPTDYKGETSEKTITWRVNLKNTKNYKLRFELSVPDGTITETNPDTGATTTKTNYKLVKFDGTDANSCDINQNGSSTNGYVSNCYISVPKEKIDDENAINGIEQNYKFTGNDFVFGGNYYKLEVYAIPYTNNTYLEEEKILIYNNDSLKTTPTIETVNGVQQNIDIPTLEEATFDLKNTLSAGFESDEKGYYISFVPTVNDKHKVINYGTYTIKLKNENNEDVKVLTGETAGINSINKTIKFTGLSANTLYYIELSYETYRNNNGYTEIQKTTTTPFTDFIYTPISNDITLGAITATQSGNTSVILTYNGSTNLSEKIIRVDYTISLAKGSSTTAGTYQITGSTSNIFTVAADRTPKLIINTSDSKYSINPSFTFKAGNTYMIRTQYYYWVDKNNNNTYDKGEEEILTDQITGNTTYTTILNL